MDDMMELTKQVCTLEQAEEFDQLGISLKSYFMWVNLKKKWQVIARHRYKTKLWMEPVYAAYSCAELEYLFLKHRHAKDDTVTIVVPYYDSGLYSAKGIYYMNYKSDDTELGYFEHGAHWRAQGLIEMLKQKIIKAEDLTL